MVYIAEIETQIKNLDNLKGILRENQIKQIALNLISYSKEFNKPFLDKNFLKSLFSSENIRTQQRTIKAILSFLISSNLIKEDVKTHKLVYFRVAKTYSNDYESFNTLMSINGYYKNYFYFKGIKRVYVKKYCPFNIPEQEILKNFYAMPLSDNNDIEILTEVKSFKSEKMQGCKVVNNLSIKKSPQYKQIKTYLIL